jgi:hypothetical protein
MTIRYIVLISFPEGANAEFLAGLDAGTAELAEAVPEIVAAAWGRDVTGSDEAFDYALSFDFADRAAYECYRVHPAHRRYIQDYMRSVPMVKVRVQFELPTRRLGKATPG